MLLHETPQIKRIGYGAMVLEGYYGQSSDDQAIQALCHVIDQDMMIDTADAYGNGRNESLIRQAASQCGKKAYIATKFGLVFEEGQTGTQIDTGWGFPLTVNASPTYIHHAIDNSLERLGVEQIDLIYAHFPDPNVPIEETVAAMADAVKAGKVAALGLSNVTADQIIRADAVHNIAAVQYEYSLFRREAELSILPAVTSINATLVCWSPLGAGFLTGTVKSLGADDFRNNNPKMQGENFTNNLQRLAAIEAIASELAITPAQLALAWVLAQSPCTLPIPGSRNIGRIDENLAALDITLSAEVLKRLDDIAPIGAFHGTTLV